MLLYEKASFPELIVSLRVQINSQANTHLSLLFHPLKQGLPASLAVCLRSVIVGSWFCDSPPLVGDFFSADLHGNFRNQLSVKLGLVPVVGELLTPLCGWVEQISDWKSASTKAPSSSPAGSINSSPKMTMLCSVVTRKYGWDGSFHRFREISPLFMSLLASFWSSSFSSSSDDPISHLDSYFNGRTIFL